MKTSLLKTNCLAAVLAALAAQLVTAPLSSAADLFPINVNAVSVSTNQDGNLDCHHFNNWTILQATAAQQGLTNLTGLSVVYDLQADAIEVVSGTNNTVLDTPLTFAGGVSLNNTNYTRVRRLANVYWETNQTASGTLFAGESIHYGDTNQVTGFSLVGQLQFARPGDGTNSPAIYYGLIQTSRSGECSTERQNRQEQQGQNEDNND